MTSLLKITLKDGRVITGRAAFGKGSPADPMTFAEAATKFRGCAEYADWPQDKTEKIIALVRTLETVAGMSVLTPLLSTNAG
jgi:2-methylcitrate dehydratase PrpD